MKKCTKVIILWTKVIFIMVELSKSSFYNLISIINVHYKVLT